MEIKIIVILILVLVLIGLAAVAVSWFVIPKNTETQKNQQQDEIVIEDRKITDNKKPFKIDVVYPYVAGLDEFNNKVEGYVNSQISDFKTYSLENDEAVKKNDPESYTKYPRTYELKIIYEKGQIGKDTISVILTVYSYTGGAHGSTNFIPINYNVKDKKEIKLTDLFSGQADYVRKISDYCINDLNKQVEERMGDAKAGWVNQGAGPKEENFSVFLVDKDSITFYFPQYQVAPYAAGDFKVAMPR